MNNNGSKERTLTHTSIYCSSTAVCAHGFYFAHTAPEIIGYMIYMIWEKRNISMLFSYKKSMVHTTKAPDTSVNNRTIFVVIESSLPILYEV